MSSDRKIVPAVFFKTKGGTEPVREWLLNLTKEDRSEIGKDIRTVELGWPIGMPVCRSIGDGLLEVRTNLSNNRIARVLFFFNTNSELVLLHGFMKKTEKTPEAAKKLAKKRKREVENG